jgi:hypothetical protein
MGNRQTSVDSEILSAAVPVLEERVRSQAASPSPSPGLLPESGVTGSPRCPSLRPVHRKRLISGS